MGKILSLIASVVIVVVFVYAFTSKPKVKLDANGFPINPKVGDKFVKSGVTYEFRNPGGWTAMVPNTDTPSRSMFTFTQEGIAKIVEDAESARVSQSTLGSRINKYISDSGLTRQNACSTLMDWCLDADNGAGAFNNFYCKAWASACGINSSRSIREILLERKANIIANCPDWSSRTPIFTTPGEIGFENSPGMSGYTVDCPRCVKYKGKIYTNFRGNNGFIGRCYYKI